MIDCRLDAPDWISVRQALALALAYGRAVRVVGGALTADRDEAAAPLAAFIETTVAVHGLGRLARNGDDILYWPKSVIRNSISIDTGPLVPAAEALLFLMPALLERSFRCVVAICGSTHGGPGYPVNFLKECLLPSLESNGRYAGVSLKRYGFYGSGGGLIEARVYPCEGAGGGVTPTGNGRRIVAGRILFSGLGTPAAGLQKEALESGIAGAAPVSIVEVIDADGPGNVVEVVLDLGGVPVVLYRNIAVVSPFGEPVFDTAAAHAAIADLGREARELAAGAGLPVTLLRELIPFGIEIPEGAGGQDPLVETAVQIRQLFV